MANANNPHFTQAVVNKFADEFLLLLDAGTAAIINIYAADMPTDADTAIGAQVLLATLTCSGTAGVVSDGAPGGLLTFSAITDDSSADATDTADFARIFTQAGGTVIMDCEVGTATTDIQFNTVAFTSGSAISISALTITFPES